MTRNFEGNDNLRQTLMNRAPKFGNDDDYVDQYWETLVFSTRSRNIGTTGAVFIIRESGRRFGHGSGMAGGGRETVPSGRMAYEALAEEDPPLLGGGIVKDRPPQ